VSSFSQRRSHKLQRIPINKIVDAEIRLRAIDESIIDGLIASIKHCGLLQPVMVAPRLGKFVIIFGSHRLEACKRLGWTEIPAIVEEVDDQESFILRVVENIQRNLRVNPVEEAKGYRMLINKGMTIQGISSRIGKSYQYVWSRLRLLETLHPKILDGIGSGKYRRLTASHAEQLSMLEDAERQIELADAIEDFGMSVGRLEKIVYGINSGAAPRLAQSQEGMQVFRRGNSIYDNFLGKVERVTLMTDTTLNALASYLGRRGRRAGRQIGKARRRMVLENAELASPRNRTLAAYFNETFGWGKLSVSETEIVVEDPILHELEFLTGYLEGFLGVELSLVANLAGTRTVFRIVN
jgi:ParB family chromosome partitioning protein